MPVVAVGAAKRVAVVRPAFLPFDEPQPALAEVSSRKALCAMAVCYGFAYCLLVRDAGYNGVAEVLCLT